MYRKIGVQKRMGAMRELSEGAKQADVCRKYSISSATASNWFKIIAKPIEEEKVEIKEKGTMPIQYKVNVGGKYKVLPEFKGFCGSLSGDFDHIVVTGIDEDKGLEYEAYDSKGNSKGDCYGCFKPHMLVPVEASFENLYEGQKLLAYGDEYTVLFANGLVAIVSDEDGESSTVSAEEFSEREFEFVGEAEKVTELTMEEVAKLAGVDVKNLKIK